MLQYKVVHVRAKSMYDAIAKLGKEVNVLISIGWKPQGGVSTVYRDDVLYEENTYQMIQAMIKED